MNKVLFGLSVLVGIVLGLAVSRPALADRLYSVPSTNDLAVSANATASFALSKPADWVWIKNDCNASLYFGFNRIGTNGTRSNYPVRLDASQDASFSIRVVSVEASNSGSTNCTFTLQGAHE